MGAWSHEPFGNDTANDWAYELEKSGDLSVIEEALDAVLDQGAEYLDASDAEVAVGAVEVLAKLLGRGTQSDAYTRKVDDWVKSVTRKPNPALLQKARQAIQRILAEDSELLELWQEGDEFNDWRASMSKLLEAVRV